jgi:predicted nucleotidyltransferase
LILRQYGENPNRATNDVDFGVQVENWEQIESLKSGLQETGWFSPDRSQPQRMRYLGGFVVDLVPFGGIEAADGTIKWPPDQAVAMNVRGFDDACNGSVILEVTPDISLPMCTLAGLALMKLMAWGDRSHERRKDAVDLAYLARKYLDLGNHDRIGAEWGDCLDLVDDEDFDYELASARILGRDIAQIATTLTQDRIEAILLRETSDDGGFALVNAMVQGPALEPDRFDRNLESLKALRMGLLDDSHKEPKGDE